MNDSQLTVIKQLCSLSTARPKLCRSGIVTNPSSSSPSTSLLHSLHWLYTSLSSQVYRIKYKIPCLTFKAIHRKTPHYLHSIISCYQPPRPFLFLSELRQISTNFDNFWQKDGKEAEIMRDTLIFTSPNSLHHTTVLNADVRNCYITLKVV